MFFKEIPGQSDIKKRLINSVLSSRISHAQLFTGAEGTMKLPMAIAYARFICCTNRQIPSDNTSCADSCGTCPSCLKFSNLAHPDLHFVFPVITAEKLSKPVSDDYILQWRELCKEKQGLVSQNEWFKKLEVENKQPSITVEDCNKIIKKLSYKSYESEYKVMVIWLPEKMHHASAPRLLKILEEPPEKTLFILIANDIAMMLATILSRTQMIRFSRLKREEVKGWLEHKGFQGHVAARSAMLADGNIHRALELASANETMELYFTYFRQWLRYCFKPQTDLVDLVAHSEMLAGMGREAQKRFLAYCLDMLRQCFYARESNIIPDTSSEEGAFIKNLAPFVHRANTEGYQKLFSDAIYHVERNANPKILFMDVSLNLVKLIKQPA
jgi:DNA polymerase III subunit delta'